MLSPSPTQQPPAPAPEQKPEPKKVAFTPIRRRPGQAPAALFVKSIFRPIFRIFYYLIQWIRRHKLASFLIPVFFVASILVTNYLVTRNTPRPSSADSLSQSLTTGRTNALSDVATWLDGLKQGNLAAMRNVETRIPTAQRPTSASYVLEFSQRAGATWKSEKLIGDSVAADHATEDIFVEVDITDSQGTNAILIWHFTIVPALDGRILSIDLVSARQAL